MERREFVLSVPVEQREEVADWLDHHADPITARLNRSLITKGMVALPPDDELVLLFMLRWNSEQAKPPAPLPVPLPTFGGTNPRLTIYSRNEVSWLASRSWCRDTKSRDMAALKAAKASCAPELIEMAGDELAGVLRRFLGASLPAICATTVPCGHSRRPDCFGAQLGWDVAARLGIPFRKVFACRPVAGVSHPKEFSKLPPLDVIERPAEPMVLLIDDVATSGWHMEEAISRLRQDGYATWGAVWISGTSQT